MCVARSKPKPVVQTVDDSSVVERRRQLRKQEEAQKAEDKQKTFEMRVAAYQGRMGRGSLLSGRRGGQGFNLQGNLLTRDTLGY